MKRSGRSGYSAMAFVIVKASHTKTDRLNAHRGWWVATMDRPRLQNLQDNHGNLCWRLSMSATVRVIRIRIRAMLDANLHATLCSAAVRKSQAIS
jgi:hypothetical protein